MQHLKFSTDCDEVLWGSRDYWSEQRHCGPPPSIFPGVVSESTHFANGTNHIARITSLLLSSSIFFSDHSIYVYLSTSLKSLKCSYFSFPPPNERKHLSSLHFTFFSPLSYFFFIPQPQMHPSWGDPNYIPTYLRTYVCTTLLVHKRKLARTTPCGGTRTSPVYLSLPPLLQHFLNNWHFAVNRVLKSKLRCQSAAAAAARTEWQLVMLLASCKLTCKSAYDSLLPYQETDAR